MSTMTSFTWTFDGRTDVGMVRKVNEDSLLERPDIGLWAVADGMGGHTAGDVASGAVVDCLRELPEPKRLSEFTDEVEDRLIEVNSRLRKIAAEKKNQTVGCTVAVLLFYRRVALCLWAGDSRIYRLRNNTLERMTQDHALVEDLVEQGMLSREEAERHPQGNLITRAVGATDDLYLDTDIYELCGGDVFMLCSDGLTKEVSEEDMAKVLGRDREENKSNTLVEMALANGARDNTTVITVTVTESSTMKSPEKKDERRQAVIKPGEEETIPGASYGESE